MHAMKVSWNHLFILLFTCFSIQSCTEDSDDMIPTYGKLGGKITDKFGQSLANASVKISSSDFSNEQTTNEFGRYLFSDLLTGDYKIEVSKESFIGKSEMLKVEKNVVNEADFSLDLGEEVLAVSDSVIKAGVQYGKYELLVQSNTSWTIISDSDWVSLSNSNGIGDGKIDLSVKENTGDSIQTAILTLSTGKITKSIKVVQASSLKITRTKGVGGNQLASDPNSKVIISFNRPISSVVRIDPLFRNCEGAPFSPTFNEDHTELSFTYSCGRLGSSYAFTIELIDTENNSHIENIEVAFYDKKLTINGLITDRFSIQDEDTEWIVTTAPARVYKFNMSAFEIEKEFALDASVSFEHQITLNPYNNLLYIASMGKLEIYDPESGKLIKNISLPAVENDSYSIHYVFSMAFNKSGMGILALRQTGSSGEKWVKIDSANDHLISIPEEYGFDEGQFHRVYSITASHDQKRLRFVVPDESNRGFYESNEKVNIFTQLASFIGEGGFINANYSKSDDRAIFDLQNVQILDGSDIYKPGHLGYSNYTFDFLYNTDKPLIYCAPIERYVFFIYDYKKSEITQEFMTGNWHYVGGTIDGNYLIVQSGDMDYDDSTGSYGSILLQFEAANFYQ